jgi:hypothetical protein
MTDKRFYLIRFTKKQGKINKTLEAGSEAMLKMWALQNTTKTTACFIFDDEGNITYQTEGTDTGFPKVIEPEGENIEYYCPGILLSMGVEA